MTDQSLPSQARSTGSPLVKRGLAEMLKGGVIMDVVNPEQARIAEDAGAVAVMALALAFKVVVTWPWMQQDRIPNTAFFVVWASVMVVPLMISFVSVHWRS